MATWPRVRIQTNAGPADAIAPYIISASRSTDIPAFYGDWFMRRLEAGYVKWVNPFNRRPQYVSLANARVIVFWSKNPAPMLLHLAALDRAGISFYFQFTLNDYDDAGLEPHVPPLAQRIATFRQLSGRLGAHRVIWRFDPLILTDQLDVERLLTKVQRVGDAVHAHTEKLVFSYADIARYAQVQRNLRAAGIAAREFTPAEMHALAAGIAALARRWGLQAATCAEEIDLTAHGIAPNRCVDDALIMRLRPSDDELRTFIYPSPRQPTLGLGHPRPTPHKDPGQRQPCGCIVSKDIGCYHTCGHLCRYCYANASADVVQRNIRLAQATPHSESIIP